MIVTTADGYDNVDGVEWSEVWECDPPAIGVKFQVTEERWNSDDTLRFITRIRVIG